MISLCPKGRCIEQVLTDIWIDFVFIVNLMYSVSITTLNSKQPHVSFGSCIAGGRTTQHDMECDVYLGNITFILDLQASGKATSCHANLKLYQVSAHRLYNFFVSCLEDKNKGQALARRRRATLVRIKRHEIQITKI